MLLTKTVEKLVFIPIIGVKWKHSNAYIILLDFIK